MFFKCQENTKVNIQTNIGHFKDYHGSDTHMYIQQIFKNDVRNLYSTTYTVYARVPQIGLMFGHGICKSVVSNTNSDWAILRFILFCRPQTKDQINTYINIFIVIIEYPILCNKRCILNKGWFYLILQTLFSSKKWPRVVITFLAKPGILANRF